MRNRFSEFNPAEKTILRVLLQNHANTVSEIGLYGGAGERLKMGAYLAVIEALEDEIEEA